MNDSEFRNGKKILVDDNAIFFWTNLIFTARIILAFPLYPSGIRRNLRPSVRFSTDSDTVFWDLVRNIPREFQTRWDFTTKRMRDINRMMHFEAQVTARADWSDKLTEEEEKRVEEFFGIANVANLEKKLGIITDDERIMNRLKLREAIKMFPSLSDEEKKFLMSRNVQPEIVGAVPEWLPNGLPANADVLRSFQLCKTNLDRANRHYDSFNFCQTVSFLRDHSDTRSPFGPISSVACFEELGTPIRLIHLMSHLGTPVPQTKILLKIVTGAVVSSSGAVSMIVADETGQYILLQMYNVRNAKTAIQNLTPGARYFLRNPFLKLGKDSTPFLTPRSALL
jgi:hypothetical protein